MKTRYKFAAMSLACLLVATAFLIVNQKVSAAGEGKITGTIKLDGTAPHQKPIDMSKEPSCAAKHAGKPITTESVVSNNGALQYVVVYLSEGLSGAAANAVPSEQPEFNQSGCQYIPHVIAMDVGQSFKVVNSDQTSHNIHPQPKAGGGNQEWNKSQPPGTPPFVVKWNSEEIAVPVKCNIHPWMHGYMAVVKGPYAVSGENGSYTIEGVPPGSYTVSAWQETYGAQTQKVTVAGGKPTSADFTFKAK
jgi:carboxypeptidase family protein